MEQPSLYRSVCPFFLSLSFSVFLAFIPSQLPSFTLSLTDLSVCVCTGTTLSPSYLPSHISSSLSPIWPCCHDNLMFRLSLSMHSTSLCPWAMSLALHSAQHQRGNNLMWPYTQCVWSEWEVSKHTLKSSI